jgi:subtilisin family serine protease
MAVFEDEMAELTTSTTPDFLGLTDPDNGVWNDYLGEDVIIGIIDSGVWPENPSFSDRTGSNKNGVDGKLDYQQIPGWHGKCTPGEDFTASDCNQKLIGAQYFVKGFGGAEAVKAGFPLEFISPRDADGHGTHTATTAGGNQGVQAILDDGTNLGTINGIAPRARIAAYKTCWGYFSEGGCFGSDNVAAIDQAVADGVDVINFSISGTSTNFLDPTEVAFLFAADAGVVVNVSAGNSGPGAATVAHPSPWVTTVAAGTHDRGFEGTVTLGDGTVYGGVPSYLSPGTGELPLVFAGDVPAAGVSPADAARCFPNTLDDGAVAGKMVLCNRGVIARTDKSAEVARAGGLAMIHGNVGAGSLNADLHAVPTIHVDDATRQAVASYISSSPSPKAQLSPASPVTAVAPEVAAFSSRGPLLASGDLLKPDIMGPGVDVLAGYSPQTGNAFDFLSGTSMSSPHLAGVSALMKDAHPDWSPAMIKSALMTSASTLNNQGDPIPGGAFDYGSGQVTPNSAIDPGLVYDAGFLDYFGFLCGTGQLVSPSCGALEIDPSDLNQPNIAIGELAGSQTVTRTVTNVGPAATYNVSVDAPAGIDVAVSPSSITLAKGESASYEVTFTTTPTATIGATVFGSLTWSHGPHNVRSQLVVTPVQLAAPSEVLGSGVEGETTYEIAFGYEGAFTAAAHGLEAAGLTSGNVPDDPGNSFAPGGPGTTLHRINVPTGAAYARFSLFDDYTDGNDDLDLYVFYPSGVFAGGSGSGTSAEQVDVLFPPAGDYYVFVHGWQTDGADSNYTLFDWSVSADPANDDGSLSVTAPAAATLGETANVTASWSGLDAGTKYLGAVSYSDAGGVFGLTLVNVQTD